MFRRLLSVLTLIIAITLLAACGGGNGPENSVISFYQAMGKNDTEAAVNLISLPDNSTQANTYKSAYGFVISAGHTGFEAHNGIKKISTGKVKYGDGKKTAIVQVKIVFNDGEAVEQNVPTVYKNDKWLLKIQ